MKFSIENETIDIKNIDGVIINGKKYYSNVVNVELPQKYIINKNATILIWEDDSKTLIKRMEQDEYNKKMGFLIAYFQKMSGLSKNKANEYLDSLLDEDELKAFELVKSIDIDEALKNFRKGLGTSLINVGKGLIGKEDARKIIEDN